MKCEKLADWFDEHGDSTEKPGWQDVLLHAQRCPDCSLFLRQRHELLELLAQHPEPSYPPDMHRSIWQAIDLFPAPEPDDTQTFADRETLLDRLMTGWARPLQMALSIACVAMTLQLTVMPTSSVPITAKSKVQNGSQSQTANFQAQTLPRSVRNPQQLPSVSPAEVKAFLDKLEAYRREHPEMDHPLPTRADIRFVGFSTSNAP